MKCGTGKVRHPTKGGALAARKKVGLSLAAYYCGACKGWHLGNTWATRVENINRIFDRIAESQP